MTPCAQALTHFLFAESGAVTVDWVVLAASVVGLGVATVGAVQVGTGALGDDIETALTDASVSALSRVAGLFPDLSQAPNIWAMGWGYDTGPSYVMEGWTRTDGQGGRMQFITDGHAGIDSLSGDMMIDFNFYGNVALSSAVSVASGQTAVLTLNAADYNAGSNGNAVDVWYGGQLVGTVEPGTRATQSFTFDLVGGSGDGSDTLELRGRQDSASVYGLWVDGITVR